MTEPLRIAWAVSGQGMIFRGLVAASRAGLIPLTFCGVVVDRPSPVESFAADNDIPIIRLEPQRDRGEFDKSFAAALTGFAADWIGLTFNRLVGPASIKAMDHRIFNIHFAALPLFPGFGAIEAALKSGMRIAGVSVHLVDETMDGGMLLGQAACGIAPEDSVATLGRRMFEAALPLTLQIVRHMANGDLVLGIDAQPVWRSGAAKVGTGHFPGADHDIAEFAAQFCGSLDRT